MMQLFDNPASPFCRIVQVVLRETDQAKDVETAFAVGHALAPEQMPTAHNPSGRIPTLVRPDGPALYDSRVICRFLDDRAKAGLYTERSLWDILTLEATAHGIMEASLAMVYEGRVRPEDTELVSHDYDLKHVLLQIMTSDAYQRAAVGRNQQQKGSSTLVRRENHGQLLNAVLAELLP